MSLQHCSTATDIRYIVPLLILKMLMVRDSTEVSKIKSRTITDDFSAIVTINRGGFLMGPV